MCTVGGEVAFVAAMIADSLILRERYGIIIIPSTIKQQNNFPQITAIA
jgi:hypothetical protein